MDIRICQQFIKNPLRNPITNRKIKKNGPTYKKLLKQCDKLLKTPKRNPRKPKVIKKIVKKQITKKEEQTDCDKWKQNKTKNPKTNRQIKEYGPTYKKFVKMCAGDGKVMKDLNLINASVTGLTKQYNKRSIDLIIRRRTKRIRDPKVKLLAGTKLTELIMILYLLKKHKDDINILLRKNFKKEFKKINTNIMSLNDIRSLDYLTIVEIDNKTNKPTNIVFPLTEGAMNQFFWKVNDPDRPEWSKHRFTFLLVSIQAEPILGKWNRVMKKGWGHFNFLVYDKVKNMVYRFEPNGGVVDFYDTIMLDKMFEKRLKKYGVDYKSMNQFCPIIPGHKGTRGPQALESSLGEQLTDPGGFCAYWSIFFIDFIVTNHKKKKFKNYSIDQYLNSMISDIDKKFGDYKQFIRSFAVFINNVARNVGKSKDIDSYIDKMITRI